LAEVLIAGEWRKAAAEGSFKARNPATREELAREFPVSGWADCDRALDAAVEAARVLRGVSGEQIAGFLASYADNIEARADEIVALANEETGLPVKPRLRDIELPRTTTQLRQAAAAAREGSWTQPVLDTKSNIRSHFAPIGPVVVFGPNNFPLAFNGISGGDFAAAVATGCPVIAKAHPLHPATSKALAECAVAALASSGLPAATVQMLYHLSNEDGLRLVADPRVGATSFTGSRAAGLHLKAAADRAGKPIYLEMSSLNPIVYLPGALRERGEALAAETADSGLAAAGQFCTSPNLLFVVESSEARTFIDGVAKLYSERASGTLFSEGGLRGLAKGVERLVAAGAKSLTASSAANGKGFCYPNTVLEVAGATLLTNGEALQQEAFGNATTAVLCANLDELRAALESLEGNLAGAIYSSKTGADDNLYGGVAEILRAKVGRLLNDKMPTGVALSAAMNHGGPYPSTGHPGFTAVGIPRSLQRFGTLQCYDGVRPERLPAALRDAAPHGEIWRAIDGGWVRG
jgi:NADP-dependent aldehyde dehydrogenase